jgi:hypothetical protein
MTISACRDVVMLTFLTAANRTWSSLGFCSMHLHEVKICKIVFLWGGGEAPVLNSHVPFGEKFVLFKKAKTTTRTCFLLLYIFLREGVAWCLSVTRAGKG